MSKLSHLNEKGEARMVDVSEKAKTMRSATARARVLAAAETISIIASGTAKKGDVIASQVLWQRRKPPISSHFVIP
jgi:cyclic pyranopterin monophosphate synthase